MKKINKTSIILMALTALQAPGATAQMPDLAETYLPVVREVLGDYDGVTSVFGYKCEVSLKLFQATDVNPTKHTQMTLSINAENTLKVLSSTSTIIATFSMVDLRGLSAGSLQFVREDPVSFAAYLKFRSDKSLEAAKIVNHLFANVPIQQESCVDLKRKAPQ